MLICSFVWDRIHALESALREKGLAVIGQVLQSENVFCPRSSDTETHTHRRSDTETQTHRHTDTVRHGGAVFRPRSSAK